MSAAGTSRTCRGETTTSAYGWEADTSSDIEPGFVLPGISTRFRMRPRGVIRLLLENVLFGDVQPSRVGANVEKGAAPAVPWGLPMVRGKAPSPDLRSIMPLSSAPPPRAPPAPRGVQRRAA